MFADGHGDCFAKLVLPAPPGSPEGGPVAQAQVSGVEGSARNDVG